jgi:putative tryptophan/tyrosine transport system substrate-binding protein
MRRRDFFALIGGATLSWPAVAHAQQSGRVRRIGMLSGLAENNPESRMRIATFRQALESFGWKEGLNIRIDYRWAAGDPNRMQAYAKEIIAASPDIVVAESTPATAALQKESRTIPIVFTQAGNPIGSGFAASFSRPGGNITGFTNYPPSMGGKWLEILKEITPDLTRAAALFNPQTHTGQYWDVLEAAGKTLNVQFSKAAVRDVAEIERAVEAMAGDPKGGLLIMPDAFLSSNRETIVVSTARHRVPTIYAFREFPDSGGLISYGMNRIAVYRDVAAYVNRILRGEKPGELPIQAPTRFELVVNLKAAKAMAMTIPEIFLVRADAVIE